MRCLRVVNGSQLSGSSQIEFDNTLFERKSRFLPGDEFFRARLSSSYFDHTAGNALEYAAASGGSPATGDETRAGRTARAAFIQYEMDASSKVRLVAGARADGIFDRVEETGDGRESHAASTTLQAMAGGSDGGGKT